MSEHYLIVLETLYNIGPKLDICVEVTVVAFIQWVSESPEMGNLHPAYWTSPCRRAVPAGAGGWVREGECSSQVFMNWSKQCYCWQPKGRRGFGNRAVVVYSSHYAQFFPVSWLSISLGSTKITWRYPSFFSAYLEDASPCSSCDSPSICHLSH